MADRKFMLESEGLVLFLYKRGLTDLSTIEAVLDNYDEKVSMHIRNALSNNSSMDNDKNLSIRNYYTLYNEDMDKFYSLKWDGQSKELYPSYRMAFSMISPNEYGGMSYEHFLPYYKIIDYQRIRFEFCKDFIANVKENAKEFLNTIITGTAVWLPYKYEDVVSATEENNMHEVSEDEMGTTFFCFFDTAGLIYHTFVPEYSDPMRGSHYVEILEEFLENLHKTRTKCDADSWCLMFEDTLPYNSIAVKQFLAEKQIYTIDYPIFSPDLSLCWNVLFTHYGSCLSFTPESKRIAVNHEVFPKDKSGHLDCLIDRLHECIQQNALRNINCAYTEKNEKN